VLLDCHIAIVASVGFAFQAKHVGPEV
jgi:hypothetical protein